MASLVDPERCQGPRTALVDGESVRKVADLVTLAVDDQHWRSDPRHLSDADRDNTSTEKLQENNDLAISQSNEIANEEANDYQ